jgi:hypothetical protein
MINRFQRDFLIVILMVNKFKIDMLFESYYSVICHEYDKQNWICFRENFLFFLQLNRKIFLFYLFIFL